MKAVKINKIVIVVAQFDPEISGRLLQSALTRFDELGMTRDQLEIVEVPGAVEIPLIAQQYARRGDVDAVIAFGVVIRGETDHYDYVCEQVSQGCQQVSLQHNIPVIFGVLTTRNREQALARAGGVHSDKGRYCADAAVHMVKLMQTIHAMNTETTNV